MVFTVRPDSWNRLVRTSLFFRLANCNIFWARRNLMEAEEAVGGRDAVCLANHKIPRST